MPRANMDPGKSGLPLKTLLFQNRQVRRWLGPFLLSCSIYFLLWIPEDQPSWLSALVKSLPVFSLVVFLGAVSSGGVYAWLLQGALLCSAVGDACLVWPEAFLYGMAAFAAADLLYLCAFGLSPLRPGLLLLAIPVFVLYYGFLLLRLEPDLELPAGIYGGILTAMLWRGLARGGSAGWGTLLLAASHGMLVWDTFAQPLPYIRLMTMTTYYTAQVLIALSALGSLGLKTQ